MSVYIDIAFLVNFLFDLQILALTHFICSKKVQPLRVLSAGFVGGMQGVLVFFPYFGILSAPPISIFILGIMTAIAVCPCRVGDFFSFYIVFLTSAFLLGGAMSFLGTGTLFGLLMIFPLYLIASKVRKEICRKKITVMLCLKDKILVKDALYDSGNAVFYFGKPVIFGNKKLIYEFFGADFTLNEYPGLCLIPYKTVGGSGMIKGIRLDKAVVNSRNFDGAVLGFFEEKIKDEIILNEIMM